MHGGSAMYGGSAIYGGSAKYGGTEMYRGCGLYGRSEIHGGSALQWRHRTCGECCDTNVHLILQDKMETFHFNSSEG